MSDKLLPCKDCGLKPKLKCIAHGYSDKDDEYWRECLKCGKRTASHYDFKPEAQIRKAQEEWNSLQK